ncbi:MAG: enoyl-CoA hydratase/isomerase family protein [Geminicoccaceae bacterium]|nr:enoyl-CoA hydratase/isomerase family protein [Geminicoccaceae bacterium]
MAELVRLERRDAIAVLVLDNPPLNLVTLALARRLEEALDRLEADPGARAVVVTGAGERAFCAGSDIREFPDLLAPGRAVAVKMRREIAVFSRLANLPKPTVAAVRGLAYGGGLELACCCDLVVVEEDVRVALPEIRLGLFPGAGGTLRVTRRIGLGRAKELAMLGEPVDAATALAWGLVNRVVAKGRGLEEACALARRLAAGPSGALALCKKALSLAFDAPEKEAMERTLALVGEAFEAPECAEGVRAFLEKRAPRWPGAPQIREDDAAP